MWSQTVEQIHPPPHLRQISRGERRKERVFFSLATLTFKKKILVLSETKLQYCIRRYISLEHYLFLFLSTFLARSQICKFLGLKKILGLRCFNTGWNRGENGGEWQSHEIVVASSHDKDYLQERRRRVIDESVYAWEEGQEGEGESLACLSRCARSQI